MAAPREENPPGATGGLGNLCPDRNDFLSTTAIAAAQDPLPPRQSAHARGLLDRQGLGAPSLQNEGAP
jgi:hypothetical protein